MTPRAKSIATSFAVGAGVAVVASLVLKSQLESEFGAGAAELQARLEDRGSDLRRQIVADATAAGRAAAIHAMNDYGITPGLILEVQRLADAGTALVGVANQAHKTLGEMITEMRTRAAKIAAGTATSFA